MNAAEEHLKRSGRRMAALIERVGPCRLTFSPPTFESLARSIVYQQISIHAARSIHQRLLAECSIDEVLNAETLASATPEKLRACGLSAQKASYLRDLAKHTVEQRLDFARLLQLSDEEVIATLTQVKGIGVWTAQMFLIFSLQRPNVLPVSDLGVRNAVKKLHSLRELPSPAEVETRGRKWRPYASVASWYLWRSLEPSGPF
ncbi:MAG: DNA-3-methyladenine glycosylase 2 family protein [Bryobacterales bacterium]|nr:DNA-3-methyladenine glycosylase 2 family protein [Bryobacterales bacterium]